MKWLGFPVRREQASRIRSSGWKKRISKEVPAKFECARGKGISNREEYDAGMIRNSDNAARRIGEDKTGFFGGDGL